MQLGAEAVFVGSGIFMSKNPKERAAAIVQAVTHFQDAATVTRVSSGLGTAMHGVDPKRESVSLEKN
jgi:pyridoxal 5'-phosphate synthase pdxS subunit